MDAALARDPLGGAGLRAQGFVGWSWQAPGETLSTNIISEVNLLEAIRAMKLSLRCVIVGNSKEYGIVHEDEVPIRGSNRTVRSQPTRPTESRQTQDLVAATCSWSRTSPARWTRSRLICLRPRSSPAMRVGDRKPRRDYSDVRDIVRG